MTVKEFYGLHPHLGPRLCRRAAAGWAPFKAGDELISGLFRIEQGVFLKMDRSLLAYKNNGPSNDGCMFFGFARMLVVAPMALANIGDNH